MYPLIGKVGKDNPILCLDIEPVKILVFTKYINDIYAQEEGNNDTLQVLKTISIRMYFFCVILLQRRQ